MIAVSDIQTYKCSAYPTFQVILLPLNSYKCYIIRIFYIYGYLVLHLRDSFSYSSYFTSGRHEGVFFKPTFVVL